MKSNLAEAPAETKILRLPRAPRKATKQTRQRFVVSPFTNATGTQSWRVAGYKSDGTRIRENFADEASARGRQIELETEFLQLKSEVTLRATNLSAEQLELAGVAIRKLGEDWPMLVDAIEHWKRTGKRSGNAESPRLDDAIGQYLAWLETSTMRDATKRHWAIRMKVFRGLVPNIRVADATPETVEAYLVKRHTSPAGKDTDRRAVSRFFSWCIERPRRWATSNPCREVRIEQGEAAPPAVLSVAECERLLRAAEAHKGGLLVPYVAVCLFGGLRPFEASRLTWEQVNLADGEIRLEANQTKTGRARVVTVCPTLARWLKACQGREFFPANWRKEFDALRLAAKIATWPHDVMRHTAISHFFRLTGSYGKAAEQFGNSEAIIKTHYQSRVSSSETKEFYAIRPQAR